MEEEKIKDFDKLKALIKDTKIPSKKLVYILNSIEELKNYTQKLLFSSKENHCNIELRKPRDDYYFLVRFYEDEAKLIDYLKEKGFIVMEGFRLGNIPAAPWYFISLQEKKYTRGRIGIGYSNIIGNHAITVDEFISIYDIYNRYGKKKLLEM